MKPDFSGAHLVLRNGDPLENLRLGKSTMPALSTSTGEFNAGSKKELVQILGQLMEAVSSGQVTTPERSALSSSEEYSRIQAEKAELVALALADESGDSWRSLGATIATQIQEQRNRAGFLRRVSVGSNLKTGDIARITVPMWPVGAVVTTSLSDIQYQIVRNKVYYPSEYEITSNIRVERMEIETISGEILDDAYNQGLDAMMVKEDRIWKTSADLTVGLQNPLQYISGELTPKMLATIQQGVTDWHLPATTAIIANDFWKDIIGNADFTSFLDPVTKYDLALNGYLGTLIGMTLITDAYRQQNQKVLNRGEIYVIASPENHAAYTDRGGLTSTPTSGADQGNTSRGWLLSEIFSFTLANARSVSKGQRV
jgi:hypothetical protein